ncbi:hypothetical protein VIBNIAM115_1030003 [Vibrio nigripulchritudo AM115]|nr:hypothetical protein VIBNIAM115_1030003 [Vibrio nigripulchritudo AM115]
MRIKTQYSHTVDQKLVVPILKQQQSAITHNFSMRLVTIKTPILIRSV